MPTAALSAISAFVVLTHANATYSPPGIDGILLEQREGDLRMDRDQKSKATKSRPDVCKTGAFPIDYDARLDSAFQHVGHELVHGATILRCSRVTWIR